MLDGKRNHTLTNGYEVKYLMTEIYLWGASSIKDHWLNYLRIITQLLAQISNSRSILHYSSEEVHDHIIRLGPDNITSNTIESLTYASG